MTAKKQSTRRHSPQLRWKGGLVFRSDYSRKEALEVSDAFAQRRFSVSKELVLRAIFEEPGTLGPFDERLAPLVETGLLEHSNVQTSEHVPGIDHWEEFNWDLALRYHLWGTRNAFFDEGEGYDDLRCEALQQMLEADEFPSPRQIDQRTAIKLDSPRPLPSVALGKVLERRKTTQVFRAERVHQEVFSGLLHYGLAYTRPFHSPNIEEDIRNLLQGCGNSLDVYVAVFSVSDMVPGVYYYEVQNESLTLDKEGDFREFVYKALIGHRQALTAAFTIFLVANYQRFQWRYRHERAMRNIFVDAGRLAQFLILVATAYGLNNHLTPAAMDRQLTSLLGLDSVKEQAVYSLTFGY